MLRKRAAQTGNQRDRYLRALLWAYWNAPHDTTGEKPSFQQVGWDCRSLTEAALLLVSDKHPNIEDYKEEMVLTLSSAREIAFTKAQPVQEELQSQIWCLLQRSQ